jgi:hypothetical protein
MQRLLKHTIGYLNHYKDRGLSGVKLVISCYNKTLRKAIEENFTGVLRTFPNPFSAERLITCICMEQNEE